MSVPVQPMVSATIDTSALRHNLLAVRRRAPDSRVMAVVKANAYGHGLVAVARALDGADGLAVARVDEGLALRRAGIGKPVVLLEGVFDAGQLAAAGAAGFDLVVHCAEQIELLRACGQLSFKVWLKLDTGMNRLGVSAADFAAARETLSSLRSVRGPVHAFTHLARADEPGRGATERQLARFAAATGAWPGERSIANSAGLLNFPGARLDWVRPGLMLYGVSPMSGAIGADHGLKPVMTLGSRVIAVKRIAVGEAVGYGGTWVASRPTILAIAAAGYGDGYPRSLASGTQVLVGGRRAPLAGRVSMDMLTIDVTGLEPAVAPGDPVVLWGEGLPVEEVAALAGAIPYELLCGISQRVAAELR
ncbi:MAG TPA: alanine racemase [Steroidobacteraceae bacterium]|nr:alanine racemase [Steroidobacteraceae bacterium]